MYGLRQTSLLSRSVITTPLPRQHRTHVLARAGVRPRPAARAGSRSLRPFFDKVVRNNDATFGSNDAQTFMRALLEFDDPQELLYRLTNKQVNKDNMLPTTELAADFRPFL